MSVKNRLFAKYGHDCSIPSPLEDLHMFQSSTNILTQIRNLITRWRMASEINYRTVNFIRSQKILDEEHRKHTKYLYIIHPFSDVRKWWECFMIVILFVQFIMIPLDLCVFNVKFENSYTNYLMWNNIRFTLDLTCLIDVVVTFFTGYCDYNSNVVILDPKKIAVHYCVTFFIPDFLSSLPLDRTRIEYLDLGTWAAVLVYFSILKLLRLFTFIRYCKQFGQTHGLHDPVYKLILILICYGLYYHFVTCLTIFLLTRKYVGLYSQLLQPRWHDTEITEFDIVHSLGRTYSFVFYQCTLLINNIGFINMQQELMLGYCILIWTLSRIFYMVIIAFSVDILLSKSSSTQKFLQIVDELKDYMKHKQLPVYLQKRILNYYEFRFERSFFRESEIFNFISGHIKQDIILHSCRKLVENVEFFENLPISLLVRIVSVMKMEIFLTNDVVLKASSTGDCMYFISTGTVAIYTKSGREVCHLHDGQHFGEIALVMKEQIRIANVVAVHTCELYRLDRADFIHAILPYPDLLHKIERIALSRLETTTHFDQHQ